VAGELLCFRPFVNINKTKVRYNGRDYSNVMDLPPEARVAFEKAEANGAVKRQIVLNGEHFDNEADMPEAERNLYEDVLSAIENNGEVTLPGAQKTDPLLTKRDIAVIALLGLGLVSLVVARIIG
jgi:hypothetical protein